ncbi:hypothetical protein VD0002_g6416 [Verticillium dahliae]|uniref:Uncharacterized protein n=1 Tax=Verticillium dahliae TaxID=27337 RepID=A0A2J8C4F8_VERDA|nr:Chitin synthase 4 [Verticillium dahliae VDG2]PNH31905.1 hypothetical protein BJF96_g4759 [Verticillium dahliae]PNH41083.1 hypothetical protein VD0004_g5984 [Verticillium dahliae]PNH51636.1 hypothetical protein VD0003_g5627 [Verticillium dahliae]PNH61390.1 hypothetical protein VD0002_g6416 [Verticillium dahliae]
MRLLAFLSLAAGLVTARPATCSEELPAASSDCPTLCIDGINDCNEPWGGCFNVCKPEESPTMPPCSEPTPTLMPIYHDTPTPTAPQSDDCSTRSVCADYVNECGIWYGGCFADCTPWPTFTKPPCPPGPPGPVPPVDDDEEGDHDDEDCERTICVDKVNECGIKYGGCYRDCAPYPTFEPPACPSEAYGEQ